METEEGQFSSRTQRQVVDQEQSVSGFGGANVFSGGRVKQSHQRFVDFYFSSSVVHESSIKSLSPPSPPPDALLRFVSLAGTGACLDTETDTELHLLLLELELLFSSSSGTAAVAEKGEGTSHEGTSHEETASVEEWVAFKRARPRRAPTRWRLRISSGSRWGDWRRLRRTR